MDRSSLSYESDSYESVELCAAGRFLPARRAPQSSTGPTIHRLVAKEASSRQSDRPQTAKTLALHRPSIACSSPNELFPLRRNPMALEKFRPIASQF
jgi:hypothetical protein